LTAPGVIDALQTNPLYSSRPYRETFNLGATGLRGWIYIDERTDQADHYGIFTAPSRQILITVAEAPGSAVLAVKDVILGATAVTTGQVPYFTEDCRKTLGAVISSVEGGPIGSTPKNLRVKRWRNGVITDVSFPMVPMSTYSATAPYNCPKSAAVLAGARTKLVAELSQSGWVLSETYSGAINGLALMASVTPTDPYYTDVKQSLKNYAATLGQRTFPVQGTSWWDTSYMGIFLSEYYLRSLADSLLPGGAAPDNSVLATINRFTFEIA
jgi:Family of unknown function (DUF6288)